MSNDYVTVSGPHGLHMEILKSIQEALPAHFPLVEKSKPETAHKDADKTANR